MVGLMDMEIIRIYDDSGHELGYFDLNTENGCHTAIKIIKNTLKLYGENIILTQLQDYLSCHTMQEVNYDILSELLEYNFGVYIDKVDIIR